MERLSPDVLEMVCSSLAGVDVFHLSHSSSSLLQLTTTSQIWQRIINISRPRATANVGGIGDWENAMLLKKQYASARSMRFRGVPQTMEARASYSRGSFATLRELPPNHEIPTSTAESLAGRGRDTSLSIDVWFAMLPPEHNVLAGGVLFGIQDSSVASSTPVHKAQQPVVVSPQGKLYCSLLVSLVRTEMEEDVSLETGRWYHLVLSFSRETFKETVYLDDRLVAARIGRRPSSFRWQMVAAQVGTGYIPSLSEHTPTSGPSGWYGFHGIVDNLRVWSRGLKCEEVEQLHDDRVFEDDDALLFSLWGTDVERRGETNAELMWCSRPLEGGLLQVIES